MLEDLEALLGLSLESLRGPKPEGFKKAQQKEYKRKALVLRIQTSIRDSNGHLYYVFIYKKPDGRSVREYSINREFLTEGLSLAEVGTIFRSILLKDIQDDGRATCWLKDKLAGLI